MRGAGPFDPAPPPAPSPQDAVLWGVVRHHETGEPMTAIAVLTREGDVVAETVSDAEGKFVFDQVRPGEVMLSLYVGAALVWESIALRAGLRARADYWVDPHPDRCTLPHIDPIKAMSTSLFSDETRSEGRLMRRPPTIRIY